MLDFGADVNILRKTNEDIFDVLNVTMIDLGFVSSYINQENGQHIRKRKMDVFTGSMMFSSVNQLNFYTTSRRDDLLSLVYLLIFLLNNGQIHNIKFE